MIFINTLAKNFISDVGFVLGEFFLSTEIRTELNKRGKKTCERSGESL
jgi:hypothetical protein